MLKRASLALTALAVATMVLTAGCDVPANTREDGLSRDEPVTEVRISGGSGDVTIIGDATAGVEVRRTARYGDSAPQDSVAVNGTVLTLDTDCGHNCSASYEVHLPRGAKVSGSNGSGDVRLSGVSTVDIEVGSGDITVTGATGAVTVHSRSGDVRLHDIGGSVRADVSSGDLDADGLRAEVVLDSSSGDVTVGLTAAANLTVRADSGDVTARIPDGCCRVEVSVDSGQSRVDVRSDSQSSYLVKLHADSGDVTVRAA